MRTGRPKAALTISEDEGAQLMALARSRSLPAALVQRAQIVLACAREPRNKAVAAALGGGAHTSASGAAALSPSVWPGCTMSCVRAARARSRTTPSPR